MSDSPLIGQKLGRYRIISEIGKGGIGAVYRAQDESLQRDVAVKVIYGQITQQHSFKERFLAESRSAARMMHPGITQVFDVGEEKSRLYLVLEYVPGPNLAELLATMGARGQQVPISEALAVMEELAVTLNYAHRRKVLHLGMKPSNVLIRVEPGSDLQFRPIITDLGLAGLLDQDIATQQFTPAALSYMAPEQVLGTGAGARSDIYSLGIMLYELLTGQLPFQSDNLMDAIRAHTHAPAPDPKRKRADTPSAVSSIALTAMAKEPRDRFQSAKEMATALRRAALAPYRTTVPAVSLAKAHPVLAQMSAVDTAGATLPMSAAAAATSRQPADSSDRSKPATGEPGQDQLVIQYPDMSTHYHVISKTPFTLGSDPARNEVVLPFEDVGARHASIDSDGVDYFVDDLGSSGGTFLATAQLLPGLPERWLADTPMIIGRCRVMMGKVGERSAAASVAKAAAAAAAAAAVAQAAKSSGEVAIRMPEGRLTVRPGGELMIPINILNQSRLVDHFGLAVAGIPEAWVSKPADAHLFPRDQKELNLFIRPPLEAASRAGTFPIDIFVTSQTMSGTVGKATAELIVEPFYRWQMRLEPQRTKGTAQGRFTVKIANQGNSPMPLQMSASDREGSCRFVFDPEAPVAEPGETVDVSLVVSHIYDAPAEAEHSYSFSVKAQGEHEQAKQASGDWVHTPPSFDVTLEPERQRTLARAVYTIAVANPERIAPHTADNQEAIEDEGITVDLSASDQSAACEYVITPSELVISPGDSQQAEMTVTAHTALPDGAEAAHNFSVRAALRDSGARQQVDGIWVQISPRFSLELTDVRPAGSVSGDYTLALVNESDVELALELDAKENARDESEQCRFIFSTNEIILSPQEEETVQLTVRRLGDVLVSEDTSRLFTVRAWPVLVPKAEQSIDGEWRQTAPMFSLSVRPTGKQTLRQGAYQVALQNDEPVDLAVVLRAADPASACTFRFKSTQLIIPANGRVGTELNVQAQRPLTGTEPVTHTFNVRGDLTAARGVFREAEAQWTQRLPNFSAKLRVDEGRGVARGLYVVELTNDEEVDLIIDVSASDQTPTPSCNFRLAAKQVTVPAKKRRKVQLLVERADHTLTNAPRTHAFLVTTRAGDAPRLKRQVTEKWVQIAPTFDVRLLPQTSLDRRLGEYQIELRNTTPIELPIALQASDQGKANTFTLGAKQVRLAPGQTERIRLTIQPLQDITGLQGRTHRFAVDARLTNVQGVARQGQASWVQVSAALTVQLTPVFRRGGRNAEYQLLAQNESNIPLTMAATASDPDNKLRFAFSPSQVVVPPAESRQMKMKASALERIPRGEASQTHEINVSVRAAEAPMFVERLQGQWEEQPKKLINCGCLLVIAIILFFLFAAVFAFLFMNGMLPFFS